MLDITEARDVYDHWQDKMPLMACEEMGELIQAISKCERVGYEKCYTAPKLKVLEEMGDVIISIAALCRRYNITDEDLQTVINFKLERCY